MLLPINRESVKKACYRIVACTGITMGKVKSCNDLFDWRFFPLDSE